MSKLVIYLFGQRFKEPGTWHFWKKNVKPLACIMHTNENTLLNNKKNQKTPQLHHSVWWDSFLYEYESDKKISSKISQQLLIADAWNLFIWVWYTWSSFFVPIRHQLPNKLWLYFFYLNFLTNLCQRFFSNNLSQMP